MTGRPRAPNFTVENVLLIAELRDMDFTARLCLSFVKSVSGCYFVLEWDLFEITIITFLSLLEKYILFKECCMRVYVVVGKCVVHHFTITLFLDS